MRRFFRVIKAIYAVTVSYLLGWTLLFASVAALLQLLTQLLLPLGGFETTAQLWRWARPLLPWGVAASRLVIYGALQVTILWLFRRRLAQIKGWIEDKADRLLRRYTAWARRHPRGRGAFGSAFSLTLTLLLVPFVVQPTLVPLRWSAGAWLRRAANLVDGQASWALAESVMGAYRRFTEEPVIAPGIGAPQRGHPPGSPGAEPAMARWDPLIWEVVSDDPQAFALVKSVLRVESAGRQFAVSRTGCAGLMQFCARTARSRDFRKVFGVGRVYPCRCDGPCSVPAAMRRDLESGDKARILAQAPGFVCELNDARFDPRRSIAAGWRYLETLQQRLGGNINLTYIGYNSGPKIAARVFARLESDGKATLKQIGRHLANVLRPVYGAAADRRARSLLRVHLPKLQRAYRNYRTQARRRQLARISHSVRLLSARHRYAVGPPSRTTPAAPSTSWPARPPG